MFNDAKVFPIFGPPGTGKTTTLVDTVKMLIERGVEPTQIAYVAFTNKAADEARQRIFDKLGVAKNQMPYFSTIHAMANRAFKAEQASSLEIMKPKDFEMVGKRVSMPVRQHWKMIDDDMVATGGASYGPGDFAISVINLGRSRCHGTVGQLRITDPEDMVRFKCDPEDVVKFEKALNSYKQQEGMYDFNDMLDRANDCAPLPIRHAIIDEAQDLSAAQWRVCNNLLALANVVHIAGDDDQAIYRFSGADADTFLGMGKHDNARVLERSYRLTPDVFNLANRIIGNVHNRVPKDWHTEKTGGAVRQIADLLQAPIDEGEWLFLVRNRRFMRDIEASLRARGYAYRTSGRSSVTRSYVEPLVAWERVRKPGGTITPQQAQQIYNQMRVGSDIERGYKTTITKRLLGQGDVTFDHLLRNGLKVDRDSPWFKALGDLGDESIAYLRALVKRGELTKEPRININTIHGVKGAECDNVVVLPNMGRLTYDNYLTDPQDEHRCAYVGATRAKENLYLMMSGGDQIYPYHDLL